MLAEIERDISTNKLYISNNLSPIGIKDYPVLLKQSITDFDLGWLVHQIGINRRLNSTTARGKMPSNAHQTLAEGEFNRFYIRGLCLYAIEHNIKELTINI